MHTLCHGSVIIRYVMLQHVAYDKYFNRKKTHIHSQTNQKRIERNILIIRIDEQQNKTEQNITYCYPCMNEKKWKCKQSERFFFFSETTFVSKIAGKKKEKV